MVISEGNVSSPPALDRRTVIAIDGPAGSGKSTAARILAERLGFFLLDSGALYRVLALHLKRLGVPDDGRTIPSTSLGSLALRIEPLVGAMRLFLHDEDVTTSIRTEEIGVAASRYSSRPEVRQALIGLQRGAAAKWSLVAEGRDMGTVVFPDATVKFFLTAGLAVRAQRRYLELLERGATPRIEEVRTEMKDRDTRDRTRQEAPLIQASDAIHVDTGEMDVAQVVERMMYHVDQRTRSPL
jgi:cytidylate kinase